ncbi:sensor domain-containing diguanylate cyclase [Idiomarina xiamenensis]|nr:sensor domain-containing diguanylate cyclase [Idiomarina xiamenensis]
MNKYSALTPDKRVPVMADKLQFLEFMNVIPDAALLVDTQGQIQGCNEAAAELFGYGMTQLQRQPLSILLPEAMRDRHQGYLQRFFSNPCRRPMGSGRAFQAQCRNGEKLFVDIMLSQLHLDDELLVIAIIRDHTYIQLSTASMRRELAYERQLALTDHLTGLANRRAFVSQLMQELAQLQSVGTAFAVGFIDIDDFKFVNDSYGHQFGDKVLQRVANLLQQHSRGSDFIARIGGDEFATIHPLTNAAQALLMMERMRACLVQGIEHYELPISLSIGLYECDDSGKDYTVEAIMNAADRAMYRAKQQGKNAVVVA